MIDTSQAVPIRMTDLERTLLDGLKAPELCGGESMVMRAWRNAVPRLDHDRMMRHLKRMGSPVMLARVGFLFDRLSIHDSFIEQYRGKLPRGSSMRLMPARPFCSSYDASWNLSINLDEATLGELVEN
jgi:predicted transcriptional regulator of viral defense system